MSQLHVNYSFLLDYSRSHYPHASILDYGCGKGEAVTAGRESGLNIFGVEIFFGGSRDVREAVIAAGLLGDTVREIQNGIIPFEDNFFDLVFSNQVFEHVEDLDHVLEEIYRVLKPDGTLISLFPSRESIREGHCGIPMAHWFKGNSKVLYFYMLAMGWLGFGYFHKEKAVAVWVRDFINWMKSYCFYRTLPEIRNTFTSAGFMVDHIEPQYIKFRLKGSGKVWLIPVVNAWPTLAGFLFQRLGGIALLSKKF